MNSIRIEQIEINNLIFTVRTAGLHNNGDLVILLHGFPESSLMWEPLMQKLSHLGYRVVAPDQRGYSSGARPYSYKKYSMKLLADDIIQIAKTYAANHKIHLVGHDIGAVVGWTVATLYPSLLKSYTALSVPDWPAYYWALNNDPIQKEKGKYVHLFQYPVIPEILLASSNYKILKSLWKGFNPETISSYINLFSQKRAIHGAINWYRALLKLPQINYTQITTPTRFIWGNQDLAIARAGVLKNSEYVTGPYEFIELDAGHWFMEFNEHKVSQLIIEHIKNYT